MRTDFLMGRHFLRSERSGSGGRWGFPRPPEKMAEREKDVADTGICCAREASVSGAQDIKGASEAEAVRK